MERGRRRPDARLRRRERTRLRPATRKDTELLAHHRRRMWEELRQASTDVLDRADLEYRRFVRDQWARGRFVAFLVEGEDRVPVASGAIWVQEQQPRPGLRAGPLPYLMSMYTEPDHRGHGHASDVVDAAVAWGREHDFPRLILHAAPGARKIYRRAGFRRTWEMVLDLTPASGGWRRRRRR